MAPEVALLDAVLDRLKADAGIAALVGAKVFDEVPADDRPGSEAAPPYIYVGPLVSQPDNPACGDSWRMTMRLYAVADEFGRRDAWAIMAAMRAALHTAQPGGETPLVLAAPFTVAVQTFGPSGDVVEPEALKVTFIDLAVTIRS